MSNRCKRIIGNAHAAAKFHVAAFFSRIDLARFREAPQAWLCDTPISGWRIWHGRIKEGISKLFGNFRPKIASNEQVLTKCHPGSALLDAGGVVDRRGLSCGDRIAHLSPSHIL